jgi:hypothetical protein
MPDQQIRVRALRRAVELCAGVDKLASRLDVDPVQVLRWRDGLEQVPVWAFTVLVDVLIEADLAGLTTRVPNASPQQDGSANDS